MKDETIFKILKNLKTNPTEFHEENYDRETLGYLGKIIEVSDKLYGSKDSDYLRNKYAWYLEEYFYLSSDSESDELKYIDYLRAVVFGFFYKVDSKDLMTVFENSESFLLQSLNNFDELKQERTPEKVYKLLREDGITAISTILMCSLSLKDKGDSFSSLLISNAYMTKELVETTKEDKSIVDRVIKKVEDTADKVKSGDHLVFETLYGLALADYCNNDKILKLNPFYDKEEGTRRFLNKSSIMDLENDGNEYNNRYSKGHIIPIDTAIDDIETLELSEKDVDDYTFYDCLTFLTNNAISKVRKENNIRLIRLENTLLENLYMTRLLLETKSENRSKKSKIKKLI